MMQPPCAHSLTIRWVGWIASHLLLFFAEIEGNLAERLWWQRHNWLAVEREILRSAQHAVADHRLEKHERDKKSVRQAVDFQESTSVTLKGWTTE